MIEFSIDISGFLFIYFDLFVFYVKLINSDHTFSELLEMCPRTANNKWYFITFFDYSCLKFSLILWYFWTQHLDLSTEGHFPVLKNDLHWLQYCLHWTHSYYLRSLIPLLPADLSQSASYITVASTALIRYTIAVDQLNTSKYLRHFYRLGYPRYCLNFHHPSFHIPKYINNKILTMISNVNNQS